MPDLSWETAELIVHNSIEEGASLIRVFNSKVSLPLLIHCAQLPVLKSTHALIYLL